MAVAGEKNYTSMIKLANLHLVFGGCVTRSCAPFVNNYRASIEMVLFVIYMPGHRDFTKVLHR